MIFKNSTGVATEEEPINNNTPDRKKWRKVLSPEVRDEDGRKR